jgi:hypothetical protein
LEVSPAAVAFLEACRRRASFVPTAAQTAWGQLIGAERALTIAALAAPENEAFVFISHTTLPVKPLSHVYDTLLARNTSSVCLTTQQAWVRSRAAPDVVFPKHSQWMTLSRRGAERFADAQPYGDPVQAVNAACGGSWRQCYPATSEELLMAAITGGIPALAMGSDWLASHPPAGGGADAAVVTALRNELAAGVDDGGPAADVAPMSDVNGGGVPVRDVGATNQGVCDTWNWCDCMHLRCRSCEGARHASILTRSRHRACMHNIQTKGGQISAPMRRWSLRLSRSRCLRSGRRHRPQRRRAA